MGAKRETTDSTSYKASAGEKATQQSVVYKHEKQLRLKNRLQRWEIVAVKMHPLLALAARRNEVAILWWVRWCGRDEMVNTLLQYSHPPVFPSNFLSLPLSFPSLVRSVDYEDTSSSLTVWPLRHVQMRSASLHCIINKSEKWLFLCLFPHTVLYLPLFWACYLE